ncbi:hypothetical protein BBK36DRAFT_1192995 [Trichoderma citrinoviride]|uniref:Mid2 domain-containing protein n=1 Tax=Trichoderma citrinoviride TaxID=58853 RepID=A0A2T4BIC2_9HYPO|nr:hypothetical protein BBK36DRAFT_1192995 [Trichoderma citrinoviride]PTB69063.1 hypothetical protein BBK36DRAFT_1192995 [Trichoderma citrinoviride]
MAFTNQPGTLLGPLTTTWTAPASCSIYMPPCSTCDQGFRAQSCNAVSGGQVRDNTACWPPVTKGVASPSWPFVGWGFYSPGLACPAGYTTACTAVYGQRPEWDTQFTLVSSETAVGCCPTGFSCANINGNTCIATATSTSIPTAFCDGTDLTDSATETFPNIVTVTQTNSAGADVRVSTSTRTTMMLYAPMFQLNFQASDLPASTTASTTEPTSSSSPSSSTSSAPDNDGASHSAGGLSSGAKVGLGVGLGLGIAFLLAFAGFIYYYRRSRRVQLPLGSELPNSEVSEAAHDSPKVVKPQSQVYEMGDYYAPAELPGDGHGGDHGGQNASRFA